MRDCVHLETVWREKLPGQQSLHCTETYRPRLTEKLYLHTTLSNLLELARPTTREERVRERKDGEGEC